jgi:hypothetical protein
MQQVHTIYMFKDMDKYVHRSVQWNSYWYLFLQASHSADAQWNIQRLMHSVKYWMEIESEKLYIVLMYLRWN